MTPILLTVLWQAENWKYGVGSPNTGLVYGAPGWIYQDQTPGAGGVYVCTAVGLGNWTLLAGASASLIPFTPAVPGNWPTPTPAIVSAALDQLGAEAGLGGLIVTYTGTFISTWQIELMRPTAIYVPGTPSGVPNNAIAGVGAFTLNYSENSLAGGVQTLKFDNLVSLGSGGVAHSLMAALISLEYPALVSARGGITIGSAIPLLTLLSFPVLKITNNTINILNLTSLTVISFPELTTILNSLTTSGMAALTTLSFPKLSYISSNFAPSGADLLTVFSFPLLTRIGSTFAPATMAILTVISMPALTIILGAASVATMAALTTVSLPAMITYGSTITMNSALGNLATLTLGTIGTLKAVTGATINISGQKLTAGSVNALLALLVSLDGTGGTTLWGTGKTLNVSGGTSAAPSGAGIADKATLIGRGATVTTN